MAVYQSEFQGATIDARLAAVATMQTAISNLETAVTAKYSKPSSGIPETDLDASVQAALALARTAIQSLSDYYTKAQVDDITAAIAASVDSTSGVVVATLPSAGAGTLGKIYYVGPDANGFYDRYVTSYDGSTYSWLALGNTEVDMTQYATIEQLNQLDQIVNGGGSVIVDVEGTWRQGTLADNNHAYTPSNNARIIMAVACSTPISYVVASGYYLSVHAYSVKYDDINEITAGTGYLGNISNGWLEGTGTLSQPATGKTYCFVVKKGSAGTSNISPSEGATNIQITTEASAPSGGGLTSRVSDLESSVSDLNEMVIGNILPEITWRQGTIDTNNEYTALNAKRIVAAVPFADAITIKLTEGYYAAVHSYSVEYDDIAENTQGTGYIGRVTDGWVNGTQNLTQLTGGKTYVIIIKYGSAGTSDIVPSIAPYAIEIAPTSGVGLQSAVDKLWGDMYGEQDDTPVTTNLGIEQGGIDSNGSLINTGTNLSQRIRTQVFRVYGNFSFNLTPTGSSLYYNVYLYSSPDVSSFVRRSSSSWLSSVPYTDSFNGYVRVTIRYQADNTDITPSAATASITQIVPSTNGVKPKVDKLTADTNSYVFGSDLLRRNVNVTEVGTLTYLQAFCAYDGKYYSTNGTNIAEQDSSFTVLRNTAINVGHGNSMQLVSGGKAWASGWDDQKMYRVDLSTLAVDQTITLPTTGYTTAAVDDANGLMYIFQRASYPSTIAAYNFIVYDYVNEEVKSTRVIESFAAMQAADFYEGKILMLYGLGTSAAPSGMRIYNTLGDVLATFDLAIYESTEPEGICFDRDSKVLLVSDVNKALYKITAVI